MSFFDPYNKKPGPYFTERKSDARIIKGVPRSLIAVLGVAKWGPFEATFNYSYAELLKKYGSNISSEYQSMKQLKKAYQNYGNPNGNLACVFARVAHYTDPTDPATLTAKKAAGIIFDDVPDSAIIEPAVDGAGNTGDETALSSGTYTGELNGVYKFKVTTAGDYASSVISKYFTPEGGTETLLGTYVPVSGAAQLIENGLSFTLTDGGDTNLVLNDEWTVQVYASGKTEGDQRILVEALYHGSLGNDIELRTYDPTNGVVGDFNLEIFVEGVSKRLYTNLSPDMDSANYFVTVINTDSEWIRVTDTANVQDVGIDQIVRLDGGDDGLTGLVEADYIGDPDARTGVYQLSVIPYAMRLSCFDADVKSAPATLYRNLISFCDTKRTRNFLIMNVPKAMVDRDTITAWEKNTLQIDSKRGALYYGWGIDEDDGDIIPLTGAILGLYATIADTVGVWENPAGDEYPLKGFTGIHNPLTDTVMGILNERRINVCEVVEGTGLIVNGSRTRAFTEAANYSWIGQTLNTQDLESRIEINTSVRHKLSRNRLYQILYMTTSSILKSRENEGGLDNEAGTPWGVICDASIQTDEYKNKGVTLIKWGIRNWKTSEFQWFELTPFTDGSTL